MDDMHIIPAATLEAFVTAIFAAAAATRRKSARIGHYLVSSNLAGHDSHGVIRTPRYVRELQIGNVIAGQSLEIINESPTHATVDGGHGFRPDDRAAGGRSGHRQGARYWNVGHRLAPQRPYRPDRRLGGAGSGRRPRLHPFRQCRDGRAGGAIRRRRPAVFHQPDLHRHPPGRCAPAAARHGDQPGGRGQVLVASNGGKKVPPTALVRPDGSFTDDPAALYGPIEPGGPRDHGNGDGSLTAFGDHKGSGIAFMCEMLAGVLSGGATSGPIPGGRRGQVSNGMLSIYLDPSKFGGAVFAARARDYVDYVKASRPTVPGGEVLVPGEPESRTRATRLADGVPLQRQTWQAIVAVADSLGVATPA